MSDLMRMRMELRTQLNKAEARFREQTDCAEIEYYRRLVEIAHADNAFLADVFKRVMKDGGFFCY